MVPVAQTSYDVALTKTVTPSNGAVGSLFVYTVTL